MTAASSLFGLAAAGGTGDEGGTFCAEASEDIDPEEARARRQRIKKSQRDSVRARSILQFFYAVTGVKSNLLLAKAMKRTMGYFSMMRAAALLICVCSVLCTLLSAQPLPLSIVDEPIPPIEVGVEFHTFFQASGGAPPYLWRVESGDLPEGILLSPQGLLSGSSAKAGTFSVTLQVQDSNRPPHLINKVIKGAVVSSLLLEWQQPPKVNDNRIDGSLQVSNSSTESFDLTVIIVAVAQNGRATAIGYQHFPLKPGSKNIQIPFGNTLPYGSYVVHVDAIAEIPKRNSILRRRLQTPTALAVLQGP